MSTGAGDSFASANNCHLDGHGVEISGRSGTYRSREAVPDRRDDLVRPRHRRDVAAALELEQFGVRKQPRELTAGLDRDDRIGRPGLYGTVGPATVWAIEAASFLVSAAAVWLARPRTMAKEAPRGVGRELAEGFRYVISVPWLWAATAASTVCVMIVMAPFTALLPRIVRGHYGRGVGSYGLLFSLMAAGMIAGSLAWARWHPRRWRVPLCFSSYGVAYLGIVVVAISPWYWLAVGAVIWRGFWIGVANSAWMTMVIELVPERLLSRVFSFDFFGSSGLAPVGYVIAAALATTVAPTTILAVGGSLAVALWLAPLGWRRVRIIA